MDLMFVGWLSCEDNSHIMDRKESMNYKIYTLIGPLNADTTRFGLEALSGIAKPERTLDTTEQSLSRVSEIR